MEIFDLSRPELEAILKGEGTNGEVFVHLMHTWDENVWEPARQAAKEAQQNDENDPATEDFADNDDGFAAFFFGGIYTQGSLALDAPSYQYFPKIRSRTFVPRIFVSWCSFGISDIPANQI